MEINLIDLPGTKASRLADMLRDMASSKFDQGDRFYSQQELCEMFGLSLITVRDAVGTLVSEGYLERIHGKGTFVAKRETAPRSQGAIGLVLCGAVDTGFLGPFYSAVFESIYERTTETRLAVQVYTQRDNTANSRLAGEVSAADLRGIIVLGCLPENTVRILRKMYPTVVIDHHLEDESVDAVVTDNYRGGMMATEHLIELGHRRIGFIDGWYNASSLRERFCGYMEALSSKDIEFRPELVVAGRNRIDRGYSAMKELLRLPQPPTAVFANNDECALSALEAIHEARLRVPGDISVIGFDDVDLASLARVPLSTIKVAKGQMGTIAVDKLMTLIEKEISTGKEVMPVELVIRKSTGPNRAD